HVNGEVRQIKGKWFVLVPLDELHGFLANPIREVFAFGTFRQSGDSVGGEVAGRRRRRTAGNVDVEAVFLGIVFLAAEVPLADAGRDIVRGSKRASDCDFLK